MNKELQEQANKLRQISSELVLALKHSDIAAEHFKNSEVPRACAHTLALEGHLLAVNDLLKEIAKFHRLKAGVE